jgi:ABC-type transport system substrate-binding protein
LPTSRPVELLRPILGCGGAIDGGWNWALYCNKTLDALAAKADSMAKPEQQAERIALWKKIFIDVMADAPWVPIFNEQRFTVRSARMGGSDSLYVDPVHVPVNYDYIYLK